MPKKRRRPIKNKVPQKPKRATRSTKTTATGKIAEMPSIASVPSVAPVNGEYSYVGREVRQIMAIVGLFVLLQLGLWLIFSRTGFDEKLVNLIKL